MLESGMTLGAHSLAMQLLRMETAGKWLNACGGNLNCSFRSVVFLGQPFKCVLLGMHFSSHLTDFMVIARVKRGQQVTIDSFDSVMLFLYGAVGIVAAIVATLFASAVGGCFTKGHRLTFFQLVACSVLALLRTLDVALRSANVLSIATSAIIGGICHLLFILLWYVLPSC